MSDDLAKEIGKRLKATRKAQKRTLVSVAYRAGCSIGELSQYEHGLKLPGTRRLLNLAASLGVSVADLAPIPEPIDPEDKIPTADNDSSAAAAGLPPGPAAANP